MKVELDKKEIANLMIACTAAKQLAGDGGQRWKDLHDKLQAELEAFDKKHPIK